MDAVAPNDWAERIGAAWRRSVQAILESGQLLIDAKAVLAHGEFQQMIERQLPFTASTARRLMAVARDPRLAKPEHVHALPPSWGTLYEITKLGDDAFAQAIESGTIRPDMQRRDIAQQVKRDRRNAVEAELASRIRALPQKRYGVIYADPEWRFEPRSRETGMDRAPENHYPTSATQEIMARPVADIAAEHCVLFCWATAPMLEDGLATVRAWGFQYKAHAIWHKIRAGNQQGTGYWFRGAHELLLVGVRGGVPCPAMGLQSGSVIAAPVGEHSAKPDLFAELIESYFPNLPKIELNARRARPGWDVWGNQAPEKSP